VNIEFHAVATYTRKPKANWNFLDRHLATFEMSEIITAGFGINSNNSEIQF
jgi:hypothetical protein